MCSRAPFALAVVLAAVLADSAAAVRTAEARTRTRTRHASRQRNVTRHAVNGMGGMSYSSPSSLWPMAANVSKPPPNCTWSALLPNVYVPGCAEDTPACPTYFPTLAEAQFACAQDFACAGVTSQPGGGGPWEPRNGPGTVIGATINSYLITNDCHAHPDAGLCYVLPPSFTIVASKGSFSNDVLVGAMVRYATMINTQNGPTTVLPPAPSLLAALTVTVTSADATLRFGVDESYVLTVAGPGASTLTAATVWGALRGLETFSQLTRHTWTTNNAGAVNASYNEVCSVSVSDAPRFPYRGLMIDTSRHFMPVSVIKQVMDLMAYLKMNSLRMHLIDITAWSYYVPQLPILSNTSAFSPLHVYYPADLADLVAYGRARGIIVWPEIDFPGHSQGMLQSLPEMGCLTPGPNPIRQYIDPLYAGLWPTMDKIFADVLAVFPPEYPVHMGGDEVDRSGWAECPSVVAWGAARGVAPATLPYAVAAWFYESMYNWLAAPPYNRVVYAWEDVTDTVNASTWVGATAGGLVIEQWDGSPGEWQSGVCTILEFTNASVIISGPFHDVVGDAPSYNNAPQQNYADMYNLTCNVTARVVQQIGGPELMFWDDAADISASDMILMLMSSVVPVAESGWSPQAVIDSGVDGGRYEDFRCRMARRGMQSHDAYGNVGTFCMPEYDAQPMPWNP